MGGFLMFVVVAGMCVLIGWAFLNRDSDGRPIGGVPPAPQHRPVSPIVDPMAPRVHELHQEPGRPDLPPVWHKAHGKGVEAKMKLRDGDVEGAVADYRRGVSWLHDTYISLTEYGVAPERDGQLLGEYADLVEWATEEGQKVVDPDDITTDIHYLNQISALLTGPNPYADAVRRLSAARAALN